MHVYAKLCKKKKKKAASPRLKIATRGKKKSEAVQYQIPTVVGSPEINLMAPLTHSAFPILARERTFPRRRRRRRRRARELRTCVIIGDPLSIRFGPVWS